MAAITPVAENPSRIQRPDLLAKNLYVFRLTVTNNVGDTWTSPFPAVTDYAVRQLNDGDDTVVVSFASGVFTFQSTVAPSAIRLYVWANK